MASPVDPAPLVPTLAERDLRVVWHPCTQMKDHEWLPLVPIERGEGVWLYGQDGRRYLDAISSWWVNLFGHSNPRINAAITAQLSRIEHVLLAGFTHEPAVALAERLTALAPAGLTRCFYADNGSSAIEVALKMSYHCWRNRGDTRKRRFITLANSYHGETLGALAVGHVELYKEIYHPLLMDVVVAPSPDAYDSEPGQTADESALRALEAMRQLLEQHAAETCAVIVEPLVQCAAGMRMHSPLYLARLRELCDRYGVHLIADEIAVGFGRTGTLFACEQAGITPDFLCLSKGITGGYLPLSVVLTGERVFDAFYDEYARLRAFLHSHSYTGNALACTAALATLDIFAEDAVIARNRELARHMGERARELLADLPHVAEVRQAGMIVAAELARDGNRRTPFDWRERRGLAVYRHGLEHEALLRPIGNVVYFMPPYVITPKQIDALVATARDGIVAATAASVAVSMAATAAPAALTTAEATATTNATAGVPTASTTGLEF
jgi:adenosylmethionine-8-amino-7-oxononanoate aminotransferase